MINLGISQWWQTTMQPDSDVSSSSELSKTLLMNAIVTASFGGGYKCIRMSLLLSLSTSLLRRRQHILSAPIDYSQIEPTACYCRSANHLCLKTSLSLLRAIHRPLVSFMNMISRISNINSITASKPRTQAHRFADRGLCGVPYPNPPTQQTSSLDFASARYTRTLVVHPMTGYQRSTGKRRASDTTHYVKTTTRHPRLTSIPSFLALSVIKRVMRGEKESPSPSKQHPATARRCSPRFRRPSICTTI
ncbi:hypothetical protein NM688_g3729 [Phlebia brevispora]|uniref:Uncharacterized protein n=1 Tax=Phlebia brevispora TaxID=194682 RepID=A0ACC1T543_9APHY|nr:hypothetical protein NM688_g3729 [Phlebia brevispora]